jgi:hypothetical protein
MSDFGGDSDEEENEETVLAREIMSGSKSKNTRIQYASSVGHGEAR